MDNKKRVLLGSLIIVILSMAIVSAGFWDLFKIGDKGEDLEGELPSTFEANVNLANAAPSIIKILPVTDVNSANVPDGTSASGYVQPILNNVVYAVVKFIAEDPDLSGDPTELSSTPTIITLGSPTATNSEIAVRITSPSDAVNSIRCKAGTCRTRDATVGNKPTGVTLTCSGVACASDTDCAGKGYGTTEADQKVYTCYVQMQYYDESYISPVVGGDDLWNFSFYIEDKQGNKPLIRVNGEYYSGDFTFDELNYMKYKTISGLELAPGESLVWSGVSLSATDTKADDNVVGGDTGLTFRNIGNVKANTIDLYPQDLIGVSAPTAILQAESMSLGTIEGGIPNLGACDVNGGGGTSPWDGIALNPDIRTTTENYALVIPYTAQGSSVDIVSSFFCIWAQLNSLTACELGPCLSGPPENQFAANDACTTSGAPTCDSPGEYWEVTGDFA